MLRKSAWNRDGRRIEAQLGQISIEIFFKVLIQRSKQNVASLGNRFASLNKKPLKTYNGK